MKKFFRFLFLCRQWKTIKKASEVVGNLDSLEHQALLDGLSGEVLDGIAELEVLHRVFTCSSEKAKEDFKLLKKSLGV